MALFTVLLNYMQNLRGGVAGRARTRVAGLEIIAHRGAGEGTVQPDTPPENTLPAFAYAWSPEVNADAAEVDIHLTRDGEIIAIHDDTTDRTTNARWVVAEHTLAELRRLDAGTWKAPQFAGTRLPTLEEVIETIPDGKRLFTEIKTGPGIIDRLARVLHGCGKAPGQLPLIGFDIDVMRRAKQTLPEHECSLLVLFENATAADDREMDALIETMVSAGLDGIDSSFPAPQGLVGRLREHGLKSVVWTINDVEAARQVMAAGIGSITTDLPRQLRVGLLR